jgi:hypothetical protein
MMPDLTLTGTPEDCVLQLQAWSKQYVEREVDRDPEVGLIVDVKFPRQQILVDATDCEALPGCSMLLEPLDDVPEFALIATTLRAEWQRSDKGPRLVATVMIVEDRDGGLAGGCLGPVGKRAPCQACSEVKHA